MFTRKLITAIAAALTCGALALAGPAVGAPNDDAYGGVGSQEQAAAGGGGGSDDGGNGGEPVGNGAGSNPVTASGSDDSGNLPFTGFQLGIALTFGVALVGTGLVLRRSARGGAEA
jgi:hypothetical protein